MSLEAMRGFVYFLTNASIPGLVKIGHTTQEVEARIKQLGHDHRSGQQVSFRIAVETSQSWKTLKNHNLDGFSSRYPRILPAAVAETMIKASSQLYGCPNTLRSCGLLRRG